LSVGECSIDAGVAAPAFTRHRGCGGRDEVARFFDGLEFVEPGMVQASGWRPECDEEASRAAALWVGAALKKT
jgi:hypothetical protein